MALKRYEDDGPIDMTHYATVAMERGGIVCLSYTGVYGPDMDNSMNTVAYAADVSGKVPVGMLLHTTESYDTTKVPYNYQNMDVVPVNSKVAVLKRGVRVTDYILPARLSSIVPGTAYVTHSGYLTDQAGDNNVIVGNFESGPSADGYVKVSINIS